MVKGSISVFFTFILASVMCLVFTMGECIRIYELQNLAQEYMDMAVESAFSEYNPYLWANYKILAIDLGYGSANEGPGMMEQKIIDYCRCNSNIENGLNYARLEPEACSIDKYALLTDESGIGIIELGVKATKENMAAEIIDGIQGHIDKVNNIEKIPVEEKATAGKNSLNNAKAELAAKKRAAAEDNDPRTNPGDYPDPAVVEDNPLDAFDILKESFAKGILATVTDTEKLSDVSTEVEELPSHRKLMKGNLDYEEGTSIVDKALFIDYLMNNYSYFGQDRKHDGLKYEVEYLVSGKETDPQCLASVVEQILLVREAANYTTIMKSDSMKLQAQGMAETLAGFSMNFAVIEAVRYAVIAAWAYAEATLDVRLLLSGGKVPVVKTPEQWTSDLLHLSNVGNVSFKAKNCDDGIEYKDYLIAFLALRNNEKLALRAIDIMENALNSTEDYKEIKMDNMLWAGDIELAFSAEELFLSLLSEHKRGESGRYNLVKNRYMSY